MIMWRGLIFRMMLGLMAVACVADSTALAEDAQTVSGLAVFPIVIEPPTYTEKVSARFGDDLYSQPLRPLAGIRSLESFAIHNGSDSKKPFDFVVPKGVVFVSTSISGKQFYCAAQSLDRSFFDYHEVAVCLRDNNSDGVADGLIVVGTDPHRIRDVFELSGKFSDVPLIQTAVSYETIPVENLPRLQMRFHLGDTGLLSTTPTVALQICIPTDLSAYPKEDRQCVYMDWKSNQALFTKEPDLNVAVNLDKNKQANITWGPIAFSLQQMPDGSITTKVNSFLSEGVAVLFKAAEFRVGADFRNATSVLHLQKVKPVDTSGSLAGGSGI